MFITMFEVVKDLFIFSFEVVKDNFILCVAFNDLPFIKLYFKLISFC